MTRGFERGRVCRRLLPGIAAWWTGCRLIPLRDDPALPERLTARRTRLAQAVGICLTGQLILGGGALWMLAPRAARPAHGIVASRRALFDETWGLGSYLAGVLRLGVASVGFWTLLGAAPTIVEWVGGSWLTMGVLTAALLAWERVVRRDLPRDDRCAAPRAIRPARRLRRDPRAPRAKAPGLYRAGRRGGRWVSALALPSVHGPAVVMSDTLLQLFDRDELAAIFAHEVAHLEHFHRRRCVYMLVAQWLIVLMGVVAVPVAIHAFDPRCAAGSPSSGSSSSGSCCP